MSTNPNYHPSPEPTSDRGWLRWVEALVDDPQVDRDAVFEGIREYLIESAHQGYPGFETFHSLRIRHRVITDIAMVLYYGWSGYQERVAERKLHDLVGSIMDQYGTPDQERAAVRWRIIKQLEEAS